MKFSSFLLGFAERINMWWMIKGRRWAESYLSGLAAVQSQLLHKQRGTASLQFFCIEEIISLTWGVRVGLLSFLSVDPWDSPGCPFSFPDDLFDSEHLAQGWLKAIRRIKNCHVLKWRWLVFAIAACPAVHYFRKVPKRIPVRLLNRDNLTWRNWENRPVNKGKVAKKWGGEGGRGCISKPQLGTAQSFSPSQQAEWNKLVLLKEICLGVFFFPIRGLKRQRTITKKRSV